MLSFLFGLFVAATLVQLVFWWIVFARLARFDPEKRPGTVIVSAFPPVSVVICARNEAANLRQNLPGILQQQYPAFEVLVVDDDSTDETPAVLNGLREQYPHLRVLRVSPKTTPGKKHALGLGIAAAQTGYLVFTDADCAPAGPDWLRHMTLPLLTEATAEIVLGYAPHRRAPGWLNRWVRFETVQTALQYFGFALAGRPYMGVGRNLAWRRDIFRRVGGYEPHAALASGDDDLLVNAAAHAGNTAICLKPGAFVYSNGAASWRAWLRQKRRHLSAGRHYRPEHQFYLAVLAGAHVLHYFLLTTLLLTDFGTISVAFYALRMASAFPIYWKILRRFREKRLLLWFPLLDALLAIYYAVFVPRALILSNYLISWK